MDDKSNIKRSLVDTDNIDTVIDDDTENRDDTIKEMQNDMSNLLFCLFQCDIPFEMVYNQLEYYFNNHERFLYSSITNFILNFDQVDQDVFVSRVLGFCSCDVVMKNNWLRGKAFKLYDHVNLVIEQNTRFKVSDDVIDKLTNEKIKEFKENMDEVIKINEKHIEDSKKDILTEMIAIVSIFVAISFVVFGGLTSVSSLFEAAKSGIDLTNMITLGSLFGLVVIDSTYMFLRFVLIILGKTNDKFKMTKTIMSANVILIFTLVVGLIFSLNPNTLIMLRKIPIDNWLLWALSVALIISLGMCVKLSKHVEELSNKVNEDAK